MTTHPIGSGSAAASSTHWYPESCTWNHSYRAAGLRAGLIALALLVLLIGVIAF